MKTDQQPSQMHPAVIFEQRVREAVMEAMNARMMPTFIVGTLHWIAADVREDVMTAQQVNKQAGEIVDLGKMKLKDGNN